MLSFPAQVNPSTKPMLERLKDVKPFIQDLKKGLNVTSVDSTNTRENTLKLFKEKYSDILPIDFLTGLKTAIEAVTNAGVQDKVTVISASQQQIGNLWSTLVNSAASKTTS
jgi:hypothetical protein